MLETDKAYIAGLLDGEGTIGVKTNKLRQVRQLFVQIVNTDKMVLEWVAETLGCGHVQKSGIGVNKPCWAWKCSTVAALGVLKQLVPYMKIKRAHAEIALQFPNFRDAEGYGRNLTEDEQQLRKSVQDKLYVLNGRGTRAENG